MQKSFKHQLSAERYAVTISEAGIRPSIPTTTTLRGGAARDSPEPQIRTTESHSLGAQLAGSLPYRRAGEGEHSERCLDTFKRGTHPSQDTPSVVGKLTL